MLFKNFLIIKNLFKFIFNIFLLLGRIKFGLFFFIFIIHMKELYLNII